MKYLVSVLMVLGLGMTAKAAVIGNNEVQVMEYTYDFAVSGGAVGFINLSTALKKDLPVGAIIHKIDYYVETAFTSGGLATVAIGDSGTGNKYLAATAFDNAAFALGNVAALSSGLPNYLSAAAEGKLGITVATAALTAGKVKFLVHFVQMKR